MAARRSPFFLCLVLALLSGAAGLGNQIVWTRRLVDVLGANADTFSKVIGAFFAGLALGAWPASRARNVPANFWRRVALAELAVAVLAIPALFSAGLSDWVYQGATPGPLIKLLLPLALVTPPATAMGLVLPWMVRALAANAGFSPKQPVWLYAVNSLGGVLGIAGVLLFALPAWGLLGAGLAAAGLNVLVAAGAWGLSHRFGNPRETAPAPDAETGHPPSAPIQNLAPATAPWLAGVLAFASGFLVLALEVSLQHQLAQVAINSLFSSAIVLALVLISLALAAALTPVLVRYAGGASKALKFALLAAATLCAIQPLVLTLMRNGVDILPYELPPATYVWELIKLGALSVCPMLVASGFVFPLLLRSAVEHGGGENPRQVGLLFAWNGLGGWLGAELSAAVLAPQLGLWNSVVLMGGGYALLAGAIELAARTRGASETRSPAAGPNRLVPIIAVTGVLMLCACVASGLPQATVNRTERLAALQVGREGVVATLECGPGDWRMLFNNSYTLGGSRAQFNQERQALLPMLLHGHPRTVAALGVATGGTVGGATLHPDTERVVAAELSPLVLRQAEEFFGPYNRQVFTNSRVRFHQEDARWMIARERGTYDVVVGDLFLPWRTGEGRLFTREHFQNVRRALKPGGLYCQWLPLFQLTRPQFDTIVRTFHEVFPDAFVLRGDFYCELPILGLVGGRSLTQVDWQRVAAGCEALRAAGQTTDPLVRHAAGVAMLTLGPLPAPPPGPINTLANSWLEWDAGRNILGLRTPWFIGVPSAEYVRSVYDAGHASLPEELRAAHEAGQFFLTLEIAAKLDLPAATDLSAQIPARLAPAMREDPAADWQQWPSRVKPTNLRPELAR